MEKNSLEILQIEKTLRSKSSKERWKAAAKLGFYAQYRPALAWGIISRFGSEKNKDLQTAIATCGLEHLLEHHFSEYFGLVENLIRGGNSNFRRTLELCWKMGRAEKGTNKARWDNLIKQVHRKTKKQ